MTRYVYGSTKKRTASKRKRERTASKKTSKKMKGGNKTRKSCGGSKTRKKQYGGKKTGFLGGLLKPLVLPALFFGAQKVQQKRVHRKKSKSAKK